MKSHDIDAIEVSSIEVMQSIVLWRCTTSKLRYTNARCKNSKISLGVSARKIAHDNIPILVKQSRAIYLHHGHIRVILDCQSSREY